MLMINSLLGVISVDVIASATSVLVFLCTSSSSDGERGSPVQDLQRYPGGGSGVLANIVPCMGMLGSKFEAKQRLRNRNIVLRTKTCCTARTKNGNGPIFGTKVEPSLGKKSPVRFFRYGPKFKCYLIIHFTAWQYKTKQFKNQ